MLHICNNKKHHDRREVYGVQYVREHNVTLPARIGMVNGTKLHTKISYYTKVVHYTLLLPC